MMSPRERGEREEFWELAEEIGMADSHITEGAFFHRFFHKDNERVQKRNSRSPVTVFAGNERGKPVTETSAGNMPPETSGELFSRGFFLTNQIEPFHSAYSNTQKLFTCQPS